MEKTLNFWRFVLIFLGIIGIFLGVREGQHLSTMEKAIRICLECIGIG